MRGLHGAHPRSAGNDRMDRRRLGRTRRRRGARGRVLKFRIVAVGRMKAGPEKALTDLYAARVRPAIAMAEVEEKRPLSSAELKTREAELLLAALDATKGKRAVVALDENGKAFSSRAFAQRLQRFEDDGAQEIAFLIGG